MSKAQPGQQSLNRTMGLTAATSIGVGTMVGAGIFVFPGIAGGYAGPAAMLSFIMGGLIALVVAMCTAELSTAMPESGGGYFFISRSFGSFWGTLVGIAQWIGLVFVTTLDREQDLPWATLQKVAQHSDLVILSETQALNRKRVLKTILQEGASASEQPILMVFKPEP